MPLSVQEALWRQRSYSPTRGLGGIITPFKDVGPIDAWKTTQPIFPTIVANLDSRDPLVQVIVIISGQKK